MSLRSPRAGHGMTFRCAGPTWQEPPREVLPKGSVESSAVLRTRSCPSRGLYLRELAPPGVSLISGPICVPFPLTAYRLAA